MAFAEYPPSWKIAAREFLLKCASKFSTRSSHPRKTESDSGWPSSPKFSTSTAARFAWKIRLAAHASAYLSPPSHRENERLKAIHSRRGRRAETAPLTGIAARRRRISRAHRGNSRIWTPIGWQGGIRPRSFRFQAAGHDRLRHRRGRRRSDESGRRRLRTQTVLARRAGPGDSQGARRARASRRKSRSPRSAGQTL